MSRGRSGFWRGAALSVLALLLISACDDPPTGEVSSPPSETAVPPAPAVVYTPSAFADLPGWTADDQDAALPAIRRSCARLQTLPADRPLVGGGIAGRAGDWQALCREAASLAAGELRAWLEQAFVPVAIAAGGPADGDGRPKDRLAEEGLFTGYYEPEVRGSRIPVDPYRYPLYARPDDLVTVDLGAFEPDLNGRTLVGRIADGRLVPYYTRAEIDAGALAGRGLELLWLDDPIERFFLHIQGSGRVALADGSVVRVGYAAKNGRPFTAIGRVLLGRGVLERGQATMQGIKRWLAAHPGERDAVLHLNESYIFFRLIEGEGPIGAEGVPLTPGRSLAVDRRFVPLGVPVWIATDHPLLASQPFRRLMVAQDTGSAIKGAVRGDIFWGAGEAAALAAGAMSEPGRMWLLLPRDLARPPES